MASRNRVRQFWLIIHRYAGLLTATFLVVIGLTGSLLAFYPELEQAINPQFFSQQQADGKKRLNIAELAELAQEYAPDAQVAGVYLRSYTEATFVRMKPGVDDKTGESKPLGFNRLYFDPYTGKVLGQQLSGDIAAGWTNFMSFVYQLHYALALGETGTWLIGIIALLWTIDCFVGFYLTLPSSKQQTRTLPDTTQIKKSYWQRWQPAWAVKWKSSTLRMNYDLHRASGLWLFIALLMFAWSGVYFNQRDIYNPITQTLFDYHSIATELPEIEPEQNAQRISWQQASQTGKQLLDQQAQEKGFEIEYPISLRLVAARGIYIYQVRSNLDIGDRRGWTRMVIDAYTGEMRLLVLPSSQYNGNTFTTWLISLHQGNIFGLPYRIFICLVGIIIAMLSITGVYLWAKRRSPNHIKKNYS